MQAEFCQKTNNLKGLKNKYYGIFMILTRFPDVY